MRKAIFALITAALLMAGIAGSAAATGPDLAACGTPALGNLQGQFGGFNPCGPHP